MATTASHRSTAKATSESAGALDAFDLAKSFGATQALRGASLSLAPGDVHALLGENGSGKSTFAKILAGIHRPDGGRIRIAGQEARIDDPVSARTLGIGIVFQELSLAPDLSVAENMFLGRERASILGWVDKKQEIQSCKAMLERLGVAADPRTPVRQLGMAQKQMVEIAKALQQSPSILIFDEPTASLTEREIAHLFDVIRDLRRGGTAILYVTHHLREVLQIADRVSVMRDGQVVAHQPIDAATTEDTLIALLTERRLSVPQPRETAAAAAPLLRVTGLQTASCADIALHIGHGEIVGLYGVVGCGRDEIARAVVGLHHPWQGTMTLAGEPYRARDPSHALARGVGFLPGDRKQDGILPNRSIRENLTLSSLSSLARFGWLRLGLERQIAATQLTGLHVKYASSEDPITALSGGNQQKVLLGRALGVVPRLLVLEDPTAGIDIGTKYDFYEQTRRCAEAGMSLLWLSSDVIETLTVCHRIYAVYAGRIVGEFASPTLADEEALLVAVLGGDHAPVAA